MQDVQYHFYSNGLGFPFSIQYSSWHVRLQWYTIFSPKKEPPSVPIISTVMTMTMGPQQTAVWQNSNIFHIPKPNFQFTQTSLKTSFVDELGMGDPSPPYLGKDAYCLSIPSKRRLCVLPSGPFPGTCGERGNQSWGSIIHPGYWQCISKFQSVQTL